MASSFNHVALVLAASFLLSAISGGEAYNSIEEKLKSIAPKAQPYPSIAQPPKIASAPSPSPSGDAPAPSPVAESISLSLGLEKSVAEPPEGAEAPEGAESPSALPKDEVEKISKFLDAQMVGALDKVEKFTKDVLEKYLNDPSKKEETKKCLDLCKEVYGDAIDDLKNARGDVSEAQWAKLNIDISAFSTDVASCQDCFDEIEEEEDPELINFQKWAQDASSDWLRKLATI